MLAIGFTKVYFTLWDVSEPYKHHYGQGNLDWEWRTNYEYLQNLSKDEQIAKDKAEHKFGVTNLEPDHDLYGRNSSFYISGEKGTDRLPPPPWEFPEKIHRDGTGKDIRTMATRPVNYENVPGADYVQFAEVEDRLASEQNDREIKALWTMYLKKSIWNNQVAEHSYAVLCPQWVKPCVYARRQLINIGVIVRYDGQWISANYLEKYKEIEAKKLALSVAVKGHHFDDKQRVTLNVKEIDCHSFEGHFGTTYLITMLDDKSRKFMYMGSAPPQIEKDKYTTVVATVKLDEYKSEKQTKLQRIKVVL